LGDIDWSGVSLTRINWSHIPRLGDELLIATAKTPQDRIEALRAAARAYRGLSIALRSQGLLLQASRYRLREQQLERMALFMERKLLSWLGSWIMDLVAGYGERPGRIFAAYLVIICTFSGAYWYVTNYLESTLSKLSWDESLVLSLTSFHGRGFFAGFLSLGDWVSRIAAVEAVIGLFIELILIATFSRRFLGNG
jgi:hypothetical protein